MPAIQARRESHIWLPHKPATLVSLSTTEGDVRGRSKTKLLDRTGQRPGPLTASLSCGGGQAQQTAFFLEGTVINMYGPACNMIGISLGYSWVTTFTLPNNWKVGGCPYDHFMEEETEPQKSRGT